MGIPTEYPRSVQRVNNSIKGNVFSDFFYAYVGKSAEKKRELGFIFYTQRKYPLLS